MLGATQNFALRMACLPRRNILRCLAMILEEPVMQKRLATCLIILLAILTIGVTRPGMADTAPLAQTPPMGWNSWNAFGCRINEQIIRETADAMATSGMRDAGYRYLVVDDCWQTGRSADGLIHADTRTFPSGMGALAEYVHSRGLLFGIYTSAGSKTCQGRAGSRGFEYQDAALYAAWGVDFVKVDWCFSDGLDAAQTYRLWSDAIAATGRPMLLSICEWGENNPSAWAPQIGQLWRTSTDIRPDWLSILHNLDTTAHQNSVAGPGRWADADMLQVGNGGLSLDENKAHISLWAVLGSPLIAGNDLRNMSPTIGSVLTNADLIAISQDAAGLPGNIVDDTGTGLQVWMRPLADGSRAVALLNRSDLPAPITVFWGKIGLASGAASVYDLWEHLNLGVFSDSFATMVPARGVVFIRVKQVSQGNQLSALQPLYSNNGFGPAELNRSNGADGSGDGRMLQLAGTAYSHGLGVHAPFEATYTLDGRCSQLVATLGIDDEVGSNGSVEFQVWADDTLRYSSGPLLGTSPPQGIVVDLHGAQRLRLVVTDVGDGTYYDHANWAAAELRCG
jgi:alpha-galactosidase